MLGDHSSFFAERAFRTGPIVCAEADYECPFTNAAHNLLYVPGFSRQIARIRFVANSFQRRSAIAALPGVRSEIAFRVTHRSYFDSQLIGKRFLPPGKYAIAIILIAALVRDAGLDGSAQYASGGSGIQPETAFLPTA